MEDLNDLYYFVAVVQHNGFTAAARAIGLEKSRLSRSVAQLEKRLGVRLLQRSTRSIALTEAGLRFYERSRDAIDSVQSAVESIAELQKEPSGTVRVSCFGMFAYANLASILPEYLAAHPKVHVQVDANERIVNLIDERFDLAIRARQQVEDLAGMVAWPITEVRRVLVASPAFLARNGIPADAVDLARFDTISRTGDFHDDRARWELNDPQDGKCTVFTTPRLVTSEVRMLLEAAIRGIGIAFLPESAVAPALKCRQLVKVLPHLTSPEYLIYLIYPAPRGMLPSVRSLIDFLKKELPDMYSAPSSMPASNSLLD
jgi:DNA-binding transcriptional LysR family regulator